MCILPTNSFNLIPSEYLQLADGVLKEYFPKNFGVDLNGKTLAWEAIVLIPFVSEGEFLAAEQTLFKSGF